MSHKSGHVIILSLLDTPDLTAAQTTRLKEIERRDEFTWQDRLYLAWVTFSISG